MKKRPVLHQLASLCIAASVFFSAASLAHANTLILPQQLSYPGLTFSGPLTFSKPLSSLSTQAITFASQHPLIVKEEKTKKPLEAIVVTPTFTALETKETSLSETLPTMPLKPTQPQIESVVPTATPTPPPATPTTQAITANYSPAPQSNPGGLNADVLFGMVNSYRQQQGLPAFQEDAKTCNLAQTRAPMIAGEIASGTMHSGLKAMNLPYWNTENIIQMNSEQAAFNWWLNDPIHHDAIVGNYTYSCVACSGNSCAEEFTNYQPK